MSTSMTMLTNDQPSKTIRVAFLLPSLEVGGAERLVTEELACLKDDQRFSLELHLVFNGGPFFERVRSFGLPVIVWNAPHKSIRMLRSYFGIIRHLRSTRCDILHSHLLDGIGPLVGKLAGVKVVSTVHNDIHYNLIERFVLARSDLVLGCSEKVLKNIERFIPSGKIGRLDNAIRRPQKKNISRSAITNKLCIDPDSTLLLSLGRLTRQKGFDVLVEAFARASVKIPEAVLLIGGDGEERERLECMAKSFGCANRIRFLGLVDNVNELLSICDLYINASRWEGLPMTLLEASAHGLPMIASRVGGNHEVVRNGETGILVQPEEPVELADSIVRMLRDHEFRKRSGAAAYDLFSRNYTIDRHCAVLKEFYLRVLSVSSA